MVLGQYKVYVKASCEVQPRSNLCCTVGLIIDRLLFIYMEPTEASNVSSDEKTEVIDRLLERHREIYDRLADL